MRVVKPHRSSASPHRCASDWRSQQRRERRRCRAVLHCACISHCKLATCRASTGPVCVFDTVLCAVRDVTVRHADFAGYLPPFGSFPRSRAGPLKFYSGRRATRGCTVWPSFRFAQVSSADAVKYDYLHLKRTRFACERESTCTAAPGQLSLYTYTRNLWFQGPLQSRATPSSSVLRLSQRHLELPVRDKPASVDTYLRALVGSCEVCFRCLLSRNAGRRTMSR